ncbi:MAG: T9SS type A sorting domain-containing protein [Bacteroidota bacterium]
MKRFLSLAIIFMLFHTAIKAQDNFSPRNAGKDTGKQRIEKLRHMQESSGVKVDHRSINDPVRTSVQKRDSSYRFPWDQISSNWRTAPSSRIVYSYDSRLNLTGTFGDSWDTGLLKFIHNYELLNVYDGNNNMTDWIYNNWDKPTSAWVQYEHDTLLYQNNKLTSESWNFYNTLNHTWFKGYYWQYNASGGLTELFYLDWDYSTFAIQYGRKMQYTLNTKNMPVVSVYQTLDTTLNNWVLSGKALSTYQNDTLLLEETSYNWNSANVTWDLTSRTQNNYTGNLLSTSLVQQWNNSSWVNSSRTVYTYDNHGNDINELYQYWVGTGWMNTNQTVNSYDANNHLMSTLTQDFINNSWSNNTLYEYSYDNSGNTTVRTVKYWDLNTGMLMGGSKYLYTFDANNQSVSTTYQYLDSGTGNWINSSLTSYYYSAHTYGVNDIFSIGLFKVFPNPATERIFIESAKPGANPIQSAAIFGITGQEVLHQQVNGPRTVMDVSTLPAGVYFLRLTGKDGVFTEKFIRK